ncbi:hypothetical protein Ade02nite_08160 [Paractinoplanes deccanensis]|uniref:RNase H type-1 domain-containing protein n=1 Tax=Paractinoplanes deccanensis TaxID=113561 RepID=A0ABQ3XWQ4_9ACTN|nr:RNase H family protein [Actinoplanes deccanensis]GID72175.1 hypothetical protein Ade02nite_08160 [Actinoplanes deccanensis]
MAIEKVPGMRGNENRVVTGDVRSHWTGAALIYTDGAALQKAIKSQWGQKGWLTGWGFVSTGGRYGCGPYPQLEGQAGQDLAVIAELRAVWYAIRGDELAAPVTVVLDSRHALDVLERWKKGAVDMPGGYVGSRVRTPTMEKLRTLIASRPANLTLQHVKGHAGDPLNEAADSLARLGARWIKDKLPQREVESRARGLAEAFLAAGPTC